MAVPIEIAKAVEDYLGVKITGFAGAKGGCINSGGALETASGIFFLKWNDLSRFPGMFDAEAKGLLLLAQCRAIHLPRVIYSGTASEYQFLLLEHLASGRRNEDYWRSFGHGLAMIHRNSADAFGLDHDNYIGSLPQRNTRRASWIEFFIHERLEVQLAMARASKSIDGSVSIKFEKLFKKLPELLPEEHPSLLHGDLWSGNIMTTPKGEPCLIDPAVYFGHREIDLAMTQLFGGFDASFFDSYNETFPLLPGYHERLDIYNLYPLLVHVNLFGGGYLAQTMQVLRRFL